MLILGSFLITTILALDSVMGFVRRKLHGKDYKSLQWTLDDKSQLQRMAYEEAGQGHWSSGESPVPIH